MKTPLNAGCAFTGRGWDVGRQKSTVYWAVRNAPAGLLREVLRMADDRLAVMRADKVSWALAELLEGGYLVRRGDVLMHTPECAAPRYPQFQVQELMRRALLDCPGGMTLPVLADDADISQAEAEAMVRMLEEAGQVRRELSTTPAGRTVTLVVRQEQPSVLARQRPAAADQAQPAAAVGRLLAGRHCQAELLPTGCLSVAHAGTQLLLGPDATRELFRWLDGLGGLRLSDRLPAEAAEVEQGAPA